MWSLMTKTKTQNPKPKTQNPKTRKPESKIMMWSLMTKTKNPKPKTQNPKPENPKNPNQRCQPFLVLIMIKIRSC